MHSATTSAIAHSGLEPFLVQVFCREIVSQAGTVRRAVDEINRCLSVRTESDAFWDAMTAALGSMANIGNILWPVQDRKGSKRRGLALRQCLGLPETSVLALHDVRNGLAHMDERIDEWHKQSKRRVIMDRAVISAGMVRGVEEYEIARSFDPSQSVVSVFGARMNLQDAVNDVATVSHAASGVLEILSRNRHLMDGP